MAVATELILSEGLATLSHRKIAAAADVPLGSITYHFPSLQSLVAEAFNHYVDRCSDRFEQALAATASAAELPAVLAAEVMAYLRSPELALAYELYLGSVRQPDLREITRRWLQASRGSMARHLDESTTRIVDALIEGLVLHTLLEKEPMDQPQLEAAFRRLIPASSFSPVV